MAAINAGISIIHINTELRLAWRTAMEESLKSRPNEIVPYKILPAVVEKMKEITAARMRLFNKNDIMYNKIMENKNLFYWLTTTRIFGNFIH